jgi:hypothetical protein
MKKQIECVLQAFILSAKDLILVLLTSSSLLRYGGNLSLQSAMSVRFNSNGTQLLALRRRLPPVLYDIHSRLPVFQFDNQGYFNSCTMKSCCFAGDRDQVSAFAFCIPMSFCSALSLFCTT